MFSMHSRCQLEKTMKSRARYPNIGFDGRGVWKQARRETRKKFIQTAKVSPQNVFASLWKPIFGSMKLNIKCSIGAMNSFFRCKMVVAIDRSFCIYRNLCAVSRP